MNLNPKIPLPLKLTAWSFLLQGGTSVLSILLTLMNGAVYFDLGILAFLLGFGLLHCSIAWWRVALVWLGIVLIALIYVIWSAGHFGAPAPIKVLNTYSVPITVLEARLLLGSYWIIAAVQFTFLLLPSTRNQFRESASTA